MASSTDTLPDTSDTATGGVIHPPRQRRPTAARRTALAWAAIVAACLAVAALAVVTLWGGRDAENTPPTRVDPRAEQFERQAHLDGQAKIYGRGRSVESGSDRHLANLSNGIENRRSPDAQSARLPAQADAYLAEQEAVERGRAADSARLQAQAERYERQAHLDGQAKTYGKANEFGATSEQPSNNGFVPGSRRMPLR